MLIMSAAFPAPAAIAEAVGAMGATVSFNDAVPVNAPVLPLASVTSTVNEIFPSANDEALTV